MTDSGNIYTLSCIACSKNLLKIGVRAGEQEIKMKAECPCGGVSFAKTVKGRFWVSPEPGLYIHESIMPPPEISQDGSGEISNVLGITIFKMRSKDD